MVDLNNIKVELHILLFLQIGEVSSKRIFFSLFFLLYYFLSSKRERERNQILVFQILLRAESGGVLRKRDG